MLGAALLLASTAFAANKASLEILDRVTLGGKTVAPGHYTMTWEGDGANVQLKLMQGKNVAATTPAQIKNTNHLAVANETGVRTNPDGSVSLTQIQLSGKKFVFAIDEGSQTASAQTK